MNCAETEKALSLYLDGELTRAECAAFDAHLDLCPVCRERLEETRAIVRGLSLVSRPAVPSDLSTSIKRSFVIERAARAARPDATVSGRFTRWLQPHLMPYTAGAFYSLLLFFSVFGALSAQFKTLRSLAAAERQALDDVTWIDDPSGLARPPAAADYAAARYPYTFESPSLNPTGALARMTWTPSTTGHPDDDNMIVVADVDRNGRASLAAVVEPPRNPRALDELQDALRQSPAFVPASFDGRPQSMRVVFVLQKMSVEEYTY